MTRARKGSINVITNYVAGKLFDIAGLSDGDGFAYDLASDSFLAVPFPTGDLLSTNNLSDVANAATALANLGGEPAIGAKGTAFNKNFGIVAGTVAEGNHTHSGTYLESETDPVWTAEKVNYYTKTEVGLLPISTFSNDAGYLTSFAETDPIFTAWDKSTGISITESQISDFGSYALSTHNHAGVYEPANANIQSHISNTNNPHAVTLLQLADFPSAYIAEKWLKVNATATGIELVDAPSGGGGTWGSIVGTLANQADLQSALDGKAASSHTHTEFLSKTNTVVYTPTTDYNPATKKYVDDNSGGGGSNIEGGNANSIYLITQLIDGGSA